MAGAKSVHCKLDADGCLSLLAILKAFDAPINEERTWAVLYQAAKCAQLQFTCNSQSQCCVVVGEASHLLIHRDGVVHPRSFSADPAATGQLHSNAGRLRVSWPFCSFGARIRLVPNSAGLDLSCFALVVTYVLIVHLIARRIVLVSDTFPPDR